MLAIGCHTNRDARWAAKQVNQWYGHDPQGFQRFAAAFSAFEADALDAQAQLRAISSDVAQPPLARATALAEIESAVNRSRDVVAAGLRDPNPLVRLGALRSLAEAPLNTRLPLAAPLLSDPLRAVRIEAAGVLAPVPPAQFSAAEHVAFARAASEYVDSQRYNADRAEARVNLSIFYGAQGDLSRAEDEIKAAIRLEPAFIPAYANLADLYRDRGRDAEGERILREGLKVAPRSAILHHALGLTLVRMKRAEEALRELERATALDPGNPRFVYVYAVALHSTGKTDAAIARLEKELVTHPNDRNILEALASFNQAGGNIESARKYADRLRALDDKAKSVR